MIRPTIMSLAGAVLALCGGTAGAVETIPDDMVLGVLKLEAVGSQDGRLMVCPPGAHSRLNRCGTSPSFDGKRDYVAPLTPQAYLRQACPGVRLVSVTVDYWGMGYGRTIQYPNPQSATLITSGACVEQSKSQAD